MARRSPKPMKAPWDQARVECTSTRGDLPGGGEGYRPNMEICKSSSSLKLSSRLYHARCRRPRRRAPGGGARVRPPRARPAAEARRRRCEDERVCRAARGAACCGLDGDLLSCSSDWCLRRRGRPGRGGAAAVQRAARDDRTAQDAESAQVPVGARALAGGAALCRARCTAAHRRRSARGARAKALPGEGGAPGLASGSRGAALAHGHAPSLHDRVRDPLCCRACEYESMRLTLCAYVHFPLPLPHAGLTCRPTPFPSFYRSSTSFRATGRRSSSSVRTSRPTSCSRSAERTPRAEQARWSSMTRG